MGKPAPKPQPDAPRPRHVPAFDRFWHRAKILAGVILTYAVVAAVMRRLGYPWPTLEQLIPVAGGLLLSALLFLVWVVRRKPGEFIADATQMEAWGYRLPEPPGDDETPPGPIIPPTPIDHVSVPHRASQSPSSPSALVPVFQAPAHDPAED